MPASMFESASKPAAARSTLLLALSSVAVLALSACGLSGTDGNKDDTAAAPAAGATIAAAPAANDPDYTKLESTDIADVQARPDMQVQVVLDQLGFGPGVIDGKMGLSTHNGLMGFQEANGLQASGKLDETTKSALAQWANVVATKVVRIPDSWATVEYLKTPDGPEAQSKLKQLGYQSLDEKLAERFHTTVEVLKQLNPGGQPAGSPAPVAGKVPVSATATPTPTPSPAPSASASGVALPAVFSAGQLVRVPNVGMGFDAASSGDNPDWSRTLASLGVAPNQPKVARLTVDKSESVLRAYDASDKLVALFTVTSGSSHDPLPLGDWKINVVSKNPPFNYNPDLFWDAKAGDEKAKLPPGPNGPVGVVWIDLNKEHYGIHGTPEPQNIGRTQSHGCVRLTNWDVARLAQMVSTSTKVLFQA
ncbi:MAG: L,D-transpeptidase family protein [Croceibacterium sp.]